MVVCCLAPLNGLKFVSEFYSPSASQAVRALELARTHPTHPSELMVSRGVGANNMCRQNAQHSTHTTISKQRKHLGVNGVGNDGDTEA